MRPVHIPSEFYDRVIGPDDLERVQRSLPALCEPIFNNGRKVRLIVEAHKPKRSEQQNRLQWQWCNEAEKQGDQTATEYQGFCKLHFGIPILRAEDPEFREKYDRVVKPLTYEQKLELMMPPFDFPVTRLMNKDQKARYLNLIYQHFLGLGFVLTEPEGDAW